MALVTLLLAGVNAAVLLVNALVLYILLLATPKHPQSGQPTGGVSGRPLGGGSGAKKSLNKSISVASSSGGMSALGAAALGGVSGGRSAHNRVLLPSKWIVVSMACSDLLLGFFVLPFIILQEHLWVFGELGCRVWMALDTFLINASIYNMLAISLDRYMAIARPLHYRSFASRLSRLAIAGAWGLSAIVALSPAVVAVPFGASVTAIGRMGAVHGNGHGIEEDLLPRARFVGKCTGATPSTGFSETPSTGFSEKTPSTGFPGTPSGGTSMLSASPEHHPDAYILVSGLVTFIGPMIAMIFLNASIMRAVYKSNSRLANFNLTPNCPERNGIFHRHRAVERLRRGEGRGSSSSRGTGLSSGSSRKGSVVSSTNSLPLLASSPQTSSYQASPSSTAGERGRGGEEQHGLRLLAPPLLLLPGIGPGSLSVSPDSSPARKIGCGGGHHGSAMDAWFSVITCSLVPSGKDVIRRANGLFLLRRSEWRVVKTTGLVVGCFTFCWLPFTVVYVLQAFSMCPVGACLHRWAFTAAFWLGFFNSALNPFIYAIFLRDFSRTLRAMMAPLRRWALWSSCCSSAGQTEK